VLNVVQVFCAFSIVRCALLPVGTAGVLRTAPASEPRGSRSTTRPPNSALRQGDNLATPSPQNTPSISASAPASALSSPTMLALKKSANSVHGDALTLGGNLIPPPSPQFYDTDSPSRSATTQRKICVATPGRKVAKALHLDPVSSEVLQSLPRLDRSPESLDSQSSVESGDLCSVG